MKHLILISLIFLTLHCDAQSTINANGNTATIGGHTYSFSVGEMCAVHTATSTNLVVTHGVLQPIRNNSIGINEQWLATDKVHVYPNPASAIVHFELHTTEGAQANFYLLDVQGRRVLSRNQVIEAGINKVEFDLSQIANAYYILQVQLAKSNASYSQSYKIQKIK